MQKIVPHLWYDGAAEDAARLYASLIPKSRLGGAARYGKAGFEHHGQPEGAVMAQEVTLGGTEIVAMNGGPLFKFTPAISLFVTLPERDEVDRVWDGLIDGGETLMPLGEYPWAPRYGWLADRWGMTWQIAQGDPADSGRMVTPHLIFAGSAAGQAEAAMQRWTSLLPGSAVTGVLRHDGDDGTNRAGTVKHAMFTLAGESFMIGDEAGPHAWGFNEAVSLAIMADDQAEIDRLWTALSARPEAEACGWLKDRFGVSWQVTPRGAIDMLADTDPDRADRVMDAFLTMKKPDVAALHAAYAG